MTRFSSAFVFAAALASLCPLGACRDKSADATPTAPGEAESPQEGAKDGKAEPAAGTAAGAPAAAVPQPPPQTEPPPPPPPAEGEPPASHDGKVIRATRLGGNQADAARAVAPLPDGGYAVTGYVTGEVDLAGEGRTKANLKDIFVTRFDADGKALWSKVWGKNDIDEGTAIAADSKGNLYVGGLFSGVVDFGTGPQTSTGSHDLFVAKLAPDGAIQWLRTAGGRVEDKVYAIAVDKDDNVLVTGYFGDEADFGGGKVASRGTVDLFVVKYGPEGEHLWSRQFGGIYDDLGAAVAADYLGNVFVLGNFNETIDIDGTAHASKGNSDILLLKLAPNGARLWSKSYGAAFHDFGLGLVVDREGNPIVTGSFEETVDFGGGPVTGRGKKDMFLAKYDKDGGHVWSKHFGGSDNDVGSGLAVDSFGNVVLAGWFWRKVEFGGDALESGGQNDMLLAKYGADGSHLWSKRFGGDQPDFARGVAYDTAGRILAVGTYRRDIDMGGAKLTYEMDGSVPTGDAYVAVIAP